MGRRDHDARRSLQMPCRKGNGRYRHQSRPDMDAYPIGCEDLCCRLGKHIRLNPAIVSDHYRRILIPPHQIVGKTLGGLGHRVDIHPVRARSDHTTQSSCAKGKIPIEGILLLRLVHTLQFCRKMRIADGLFTPSVIFFPIVHVPGLLSSQFSCRP